MNLNNEDKKENKFNGSKNQSTILNKDNEIFIKRVNRKNEKKEISKQTKFTNKYHH